MALPASVTAMLASTAGDQEKKKKKPRKPLHLYPCETEISNHAIAHLHQHWGLDSLRLHSIVALSEQQVLAACGNTLLFLDLDKQSIEVVPGENRGGIGAICSHPKRNIYVVCDKSDKDVQEGLPPAKIRLYDHPSRNVIQTLEAVPAVRGYSVCSFNHEGDILATVSIEPDFVLTLWNWEKGDILLRNKASGNEVYSVYFSAFNPGVLTTSGLGHIKFWQMAETFTGMKLKGSVGRFGRIDICDVTAFVQLPDGKVLSGSENGYLLLWEGSMVKCQFGRKMENSEDTKCHEGRIDVVQLIENGSYFMTAGADGYIRYWPFQEIDLTEATGGLELSHATCIREVFLGENVSVRCMTLTPSKNSWIILDANGSVRRIPYESKMTITSTTTPPQIAPLPEPSADQVLFEARKSYFSFASGPLKCVASHPTKHCSVVGGADGYLRLIDHLQMTVVCSTQIPDNASVNTLQFIPGSQDSRLIICGCSDGSLRTFRLCPDAIEVVSAQRPHSNSIISVAVDEDGKQVYTFSIDDDAEINSAFYLTLDPASGILTPHGFCRLPIKPTAACEWDPKGECCFVGSATGEIIALNPPAAAAPTSGSGNRTGGEPGAVIDNFEFKGTWSAVAVRQKKKRPPKQKKTAVRSKNADDDFDNLDAGELMAAAAAGGGEESSSDDDDDELDLADIGPWSVNSITRFPRNGPKQLIRAPTSTKENHNNDFDDMMDDEDDGDVADLDEDELAERRREKMRREEERKEMEAAQQTEPGIVVVSFGKEELCYEYKTSVRYGDNATKQPPLPKTGLEPANWVEEPGRNFAFRNSIVHKTVFSPSGKTMLQIFDSARVGVRDMELVANTPLIKPISQTIKAPPTPAQKKQQQQNNNKESSQNRSMRPGQNPTSPASPSSKKDNNKESEENDGSFGLTSQLHDGLHGHINSCSVSCDDSLVLSVGDDGAIFSQFLDACKEKKKPFDHTPLNLSDWSKATNPSAPMSIPLSIQQQKLKDDADRALEAAMSKKERIMKKINAIHDEFAKIIETNDQESGGRRLPDEDLSLSEFLRDRLNQHLHERVADAKKEFNWVSAKKKAQLDKLKAKYVDILQYDHFCVKPFDATRAPVNSFRTSVMTDTQKKHLDAINKLIGADGNNNNQQQQQQSQEQDQHQQQIENNNNNSPSRSNSPASQNLNQQQQQEADRETNNNSPGNISTSSKQLQNAAAAAASGSDGDNNNNTTSTSTALVQQQQQGTVEQAAVQFGASVEEYDHQNQTLSSTQKSGKQLDTSAQVRSQLEKAEERRKEREERRQKLHALLSSNPKNLPEDPQVVQAIHRAERKMGDYILKTSDDFKIPDHLRPTADRKAKQLALLEHSANQIRAEFNSRLLALRDRKRELCKELNQDRQRIVEICNILKIDIDVDEFKLSREEVPEEEFDFDDQTLLSWEEANVREQQRKEAEEKAKRGFGSDLAQMDEGGKKGGGEGGSGDHNTSSTQHQGSAATNTSSSNKAGEGGEHESSSAATGADSKTTSSGQQQQQQSATSGGGSQQQSATTNVSSSSAAGANATSATSATTSSTVRRPGGPGSVLTAKEKFEQDLRVRLEGLRRSEVEIEESLIQRERLLFERSRLTRKIQKSIRAFDTELRDRLRERTSIEADLLMADMRALLLFNEYLKLINFRLQDESLAQRLEDARAEKKEVVQRSRNCSDRVMAKTKEIDGLRKSLETLRMQFIQMQQQAPDQVQKALDRIFFKKLKRRRGDDDDDDDDITSSDEDENEADDEYADDGEPDQCPAGCDEELFLAIIALREKRLDCDDALADFTKTAHALRKEHDSLVQQEAAADNKLAEVENDIQKFQNQKQKELNALDTVVVLKMSQVQCLTPDTHELPENLDNPNIIVFRRANLRNLIERIGALDEEKSDLSRKLRHMQAQKSQAGRKRTKAVAGMTEWENKVYEVQLLKFGQRVNLELLENIAVDRESEELKAQLKMEEVFWEREVMKQDERLLEYRQAHQQRIAENTSHLKQLGSLRAEQYEIEQDLGTSLDRVVSKMSGGSKVATAEDRQRLRDLIVSQQRDIDALKNEVAMLRRKGGYVYTPVVNQVQAQHAMAQQQQQQFAASAPGQQQSHTNTNMNMTYDQ